jgi:hypothetical protein
MKSKMLAKELLAVLAIASLVFLVGCGGNTSQSPPPSQSTAVTVSPSSATVQTGGVQQFTATVSPSGANQAVTWGLSGTGCTGASCGTIDATGKYAAPATVPTPATVTVTATSVTDATKSASATITVTAPAADLAKLTGPYAFLFNGGDSGGAVVIAGSFTADGSGNITGGLEDISRVSGVSTSVSFTGTYTVVAGANIGSMTLTSTNPAVTSTFVFALGDFDMGVATKGRFQGTFATAGADGVGQLEKQDPAGFSAAAVSGPYVLGFEGVNDTGGRFVVAGRFDANGAAALTNGQVDANSAGTLINKASMTGAYTVAASGRGTAALAITGVINPVNVSFYVVSRKKLFAMQTDARSATVKGVLSGTIKEQSGGPFVVSSLSGDAVVALQGVSGTGTSVLVRQATTNGAGSLSGVTDQNDAGVIVLNQGFSGTYAVDADGLGRGTLTITGDPKVKTIYFEKPNKVFIMDTNTGAQFGVAEAQAAGPFSNASVSGNYFFGDLPSPVSTVSSASGGCGVLTANGAGSSSGDGCLNFGLNSTYSVAANGRATQTIDNGFDSVPSIFYLISPSDLVAIDVGPGSSSGITVIEK